MNFPARPIRRTVALVATLSAFSLPSPATAQEGAPVRKQQTAVRIGGRAPEIDGRLDEEVWSSAPALAGFTQTTPREGAPASDRTEVRFAFDGDALYVGARMYADPGTVRASLGRRDQGGDAERLLVSLDPYLDRRTAYTFGVTAAGTRLDYYSPTDVPHPRDASYDPVWQAAARVDSLGWTAEMRVPFSQLRFNNRPEQTWGLNVNRWVPSRNEDAFWIAVPSRETGWSSRFGDLVGISGIRPSRRVEVTPYVAADARLVGEVDAGDPFAEQHAVGARVGGDVRMGLGPSLTLEATINPDFGQVEADPAEVNLSAFESFFPERRPFFTEANRALTGRGPSYFYSRRLGARPRVPAAGDFTDYPNASTILGAAKLSGRLLSGTSVAALGALTGREEARVFYTEDERFDRVVVAPRTLFTVGRVQQEFGRDASTVGITLAGVGRETGDSLVASRLTRTALSGGADWNLRFRGGEYVVNGHAGFSWVQGDSTAIRRVQRSSTHYFQRPDATHVTFDPARTSLGGYAAGLGVERAAGKHWLWGVSAAAESPGLELNDAGRIGRADQISASASLRYRETQPGPLFRSWSVRLASENAWDFAGVRGFGAVRSDVSFTWKNFWQTRLTGWVDLRAQSPTLTRGGPYAGTGQAWTLAGSVSNSFASSTRWNGEVRVGGDELGGRVFEVEGEMSIRPGPRWQLSLEPGYTRMTDPRQYVATLSGGPAATFGNRYLFATTDRSELAAELRLAYIFTPDLSLEVFAQPFVATGRYGTFGQLPTPRSRELDLFGADGPVRSADGVHTTARGTVAEDFNVRSFRSNAVMRWEWRPGSTLFLVWQQSRSAEQVDGRFVRPGDLFRTLDATGDNYLALKATYWLPVR